MSYNSDHRAQTAVDFLAGMSIFLVTIGFVFGFVPGMFQPFDTTTGSNLVTADRGAAHLVEWILVEDTDTPGILNETCSAEFFDRDGDTGDCRFDSDAENLNAALGIVETEEINVTIESNGTILTLNGDAGQVTADAGRPPPSTGEVVTSKRAVLIGSNRGIAYVRVW